MATDGSPSPGGRAGRRCGAPTRVDLLTFLVAAMLCSASYCLGVWHNSRGAANSRVLAPSAAVAVPVGATSSCGGDADEPLDFESHHAAESAGLSVSSSPSSAAAAASARRSLRGAAAESTGRNRAAWAWGSARASAEAAGGGLRLMAADAVRA
ncbi:unnamed protein product [Urochloa humidicola]